MAKRLTKYDVHALTLNSIYYDADFNCRGQFTLESVSELADSIRRKGEGVELQGLDFPVVVQPAADVEGGLPEGYDYRLLAGHRRFRAVEFFLKWLRIPAMIRTGLDDYQARLLNLTENLEREDLNMLQEAVAVQRLYPEENPSGRKIAKEIHRSLKWVYARLRLLKMSPEIQQQAAAGLLSDVLIERLHREAPDDQAFLASQVAQAKKLGGKSGRMPGLPRAYKRKYTDRRSKNQMSEMVTKLFNAGISGLPCRVLAWAAGEVSDEDLEKDIKTAQSEGQFYDSLSGENDVAGTTDSR